LKTQNPTVLLTKLSPIITSSTDPTVFSNRVLKTPLALPTTPPLEVPLLTTQPLPSTQPQLMPLPSSPLMLPQLVEEDSSKTLMPPQPLLMPQPSSPLTSKPIIQLPLLTTQPQLPATQHPEVPSPPMPTPLTLISIKE
jgi:hypothetical protein